MNASPRRGLSDPVNEEMAILADIAGGRAHVRALRWAAGDSGVKSCRSVITWLPGKAVVMDASVQVRYYEDPDTYEQLMTKRSDF